jgi:hypothetical protein
VQLEFAEILGELRVLMRVGERDAKVHNSPRISSQNAEQVIF